MKPLRWPGRSRRSGFWRVGWFWLGRVGLRFTGCVKTVTVGCGPCDSLPPKTPPTTNSSTTTHLHPLVPDRRLDAAARRRPPQRAVQQVAAVQEHGPARHQPRHLEPLRDEKHSHKRKPDHDRPRDQEEVEVAGRGRGVEIVRCADEREAAEKRHRRAEHQRRPGELVVALHEPVVYVIDPRHHLDHDKHQEQSGAEAGHLRIHRHCIRRYKEEPDDRAGPDEKLPEPEARVYAGAKVRPLGAPEEEEGVRREEGEVGKAEAEGDLLAAAEGLEAGDLAVGKDRRAAVAEPLEWVVGEAFGGV